MNSESIFINDDFVEKIKSKCGLINNSDLRCKTASCVFASNVAKLFFESDEPDCDSGIHNLPEVVSDIEICDIYLQNTFVDVRIYFNDNEICVPSELFKRNILPAAFMFIKLSEDLSGAQITGFITPGDVDTTKEIDGYYPVPAGSLQSYYDIEPLLTYTDDSDVSEESRIMVYDFLDNKLGDNNEFYRRLFESRDLRLELINAANAKHKFETIGEITSTETEDVPETSSNESLDLAEDLTQDILPVVEDASLDSIDLELTDTNTDLTELDSGNDSLDEFDFDTPIEELDSTEGSAEDLGIDIPVRKSDDDDNEDDSYSFDEYAETNSDISDEANNNANDEDTDFLTEASEELTVSDGTSDLETAEEEEEEEEEESDNSETVENDDTVKLDFADETDNDSYEPVEEISDFNQETEIPEYSENEPAAESDEDNPYSTEVTPSLNNFEDKAEQELEANSDNREEITENMQDANSTSDAAIAENENIDNLFPETGAETTEEEIANQTAAKKKSIIPALGLFVVVAGLGYFAYTKLQPAQVTQPEIPETGIETNVTEAENTKVDETMPIETVENVAENKTANEGTAISVPAIENNLDASILVSNLSVSWEVPAAYTNNASARRYFAKIGKIIQMNLKAELLLLSKPPINNRVVLELEYNKTSGNYTVKGFTVSSGEKLVDDIITNTVKNVLKMNLNIDTSSFGETPGNPSLIVKL